MADNTLSEQIRQSLAARAAARPGCEAGVVKMIAGLQEYALGYFDRFENPIGHDPVIGEAWTRIAEGIRDIVKCGEIGRLFGAEVDNELRTTLQRHCAEVEGDDEAPRSG